jgi:ribose transport system substrate-binding protein
MRARRVLHTQRRAAVALLGLVAVAAVAGCGQAGGTADKPAAGGDKAGKKLFVAYADGSCGNAWRTTVRAEMEDEVTKHPEIGKFKYTCAHGELSQGIQNIQTLTSQGVDILIVFSEWGEALLPHIRAAQKKGVTVIPWNIGVGGVPGKDYTAFVSQDLEAQGKIYADFFIEKLGGKGNIVGLGGPPGNILDTPQIDSMKARFKEKAPGMKFLEFAPADWAPATTAKAMATLLTKYPKIDGVWDAESTTVKPMIDQFIAAGRPLATFASFDVNGMMRDFLKLKPTHPTLEWGYISATTWGVRNALQAGLEARLTGKPLANPVITLPNKMSDCAKVCKQLYDPNLPDSYIPTTKVPPEKMATYFK